MCSLIFVQQWTRDFLNWEEMFKFGTSLSAILVRLLYSYFRMGKVSSLGNRDLTVHFAISVTITLLSNWELFSKTSSHKCITDCWKEQTEQIMLGSFWGSEWILDSLDTFFYGPSFYPPSTSLFHPVSSSLIFLLSVVQWISNVTTYKSLKIPRYS